MSFDAIYIQDDYSHLHSPGAQSQFSHLHPSLPQPWPKQNR